MKETKICANCSISHPIEDMYQAEGGRNHAHRPRGLHHYRHLHPAQ